jgi:hypothetical protein
MKSGGQMLSQSPVVWWYREVNCKVVGMCIGGKLHIMLMRTRRDQNGGGRRCFLSTPREKAVVG